MKCGKCSEEMISAFCWDDDQITDHAHNVYHCEDCGIIVQERVAADKGITILYPDGQVHRVVAEPGED